MSFQSVNKDWERLAKQDALSAILSNPDKAGNKWEQDDFFASGSIEIRAVFDYLKQNNCLPADNLKALDFGCGVGRLTRELGNLFEMVEGIDVSPTMITKANELNFDLTNHIHFSVNQSTTTKFMNNSFSFIYTTIVLQNIPYTQQVEYIKEFTRILKPGGVMVFQIPTKDIRKLSLTQKIKNTVKIRERLSKAGRGTQHNMQLNPLDENEIVKVLNVGYCMVLAHLFTNHTDIDFGGNLKFIKRRESIGYESSMFIAGKVH